MNDPTQEQQKAIDRLLEATAKRWRLGLIKPFDDARMTAESLRDLIEIKAILRRMLGNSPEAERSWLEAHGGAPRDAAAIQATKVQLYQFLN